MLNKMDDKNQSHCKQYRVIVIDCRPIASKPLLMDCMVTLCNP